MDRGLDELDVIGRLLLDPASELVVDLGIWPLALDRLTLHAHPAIDIVDLAVRAFLVADQEERHRHKVDRRHVVTRLHHHAGRADREIQQELADRDVEVALLQHREHLVGVGIQNGLRLLRTLERNRRARLKPRPLALGREDYRLQPVRKPLGAVDSGAIKYPLHLLRTRAAAFPDTVQLALGERELIGILVDGLELVLLRLRQLLPLEDLLWRQPHPAAFLVFHDYASALYFASRFLPFAARRCAAASVRGAGSPQARAASASLVGSPSLSTSGPLGFV